MRTVLNAVHVLHGFEKQQQQLTTKNLPTQIIRAFAQYNEEQFTPVKAGDATAAETLLTAHGRTAGGRYTDPRAHTTFAFDHLRKEASDVTPATPDADAEPLRAAFELAVSAYVADHYPQGVCAVYAAAPGSLVVCIEDHKFQPANYWNGRWRSEWTCVGVHVCVGGWGCSCWAWW